MIALARLPEPDVLIKNGERWLARFLERREQNPGERPPSRQYGHRNIKDTLRAMSFHKCFYCERKLSEAEDEVDHYIKVVEAPEQAFAWENLHLCCRDCNGKSSNSKIPANESTAKRSISPRRRRGRGVSRRSSGEKLRETPRSPRLRGGSEGFLQWTPANECLNPCDGTVDPSDHLTFTKEVSRSKTGSQIGAQTIRKYQLDRGDLNYARARHLQKLTEFLLVIRTLQLNDGGRSITREEKEAIASFGQADHEFSLLFRTYLTAVSLP